MNGNFQHEGKFYTDYDNIDEAKAAAREVAIRIAAEGDVLLKNENDALPLSKDETKFTLLGIRSARMVRSGFGSVRAAAAPSARCWATLWRTRVTRSTAKCSTCTPIR